VRTNNLRERFGDANATSNPSRLSTLLEEQEDTVVLLLLLLALDIHIASHRSPGYLQSSIRAREVSSVAFQIELPLAVFGFDDESSRYS
jgi:hypothetical protein